jgi:hypothetical protein
VIASWIDDEALLPNHAPRLDAEGGLFNDERKVLAWVARFHADSLPDTMNRPFGRLGFGRPKSGLVHVEPELGFHALF